MQCWWLARLNKNKMKKVTIITGAANSGKTTKAREMTSSKKAVWLDRLNLDDPFLFQSITPETEVIVMDGLAGKKCLPEIKLLITTPMLMVNRKGKLPIEVERPEIIIVSNDLKKEDFRERPHLEIIEM